MALLIGAPENFISNLPSIQINGSNIGFVRTAKSLGVTLNRELNSLDYVMWTVGKFLWSSDISECHSKLHQPIFECY